MLRDTNIDRELQEARAEAQNGLRREPGSDDGDLSNDLAIARAAKNGWERPIDFHQWDLPRFTTDALPDWWRSCVEATAVANADARGHARGVVARRLSQ